MMNLCVLIVNKSKLDENQYNLKFEANGHNFFP